MITYEYTHVAGTEETADERSRSGPAAYQRPNHPVTERLRWRNTDAKRVRRWPDVLNPSNGD
jgi:hypothetical protein